MNIDDKIKFIEEKMKMFVLTYYAPGFMSGYHLSNRTDEGLGPAQEYKFSAPTLFEVIEKAYNYFVNGGPYDPEVVRIIKELKAELPSLKMKELAIKDVVCAGDEIQVVYYEGEYIEDVVYNAMTEDEKSTYHDKRIADTSDDYHTLEAFFATKTDNRFLISLEWSGEQKPKGI